jgi:hypothetical protein
MQERRIEISVPEILKSKATDFKLLYFVNEGGVYNGAS